MNELRVLGVSTFYSLEVSGVTGPNIRAPIADLSSLAENLILLRFVENGARLHRLISIVKVRDSQFDPSLYEYITSSRGLLIADSTDTAERIMAGTAHQHDREQAGDGQPRERHGR
jgi:circadian clock protein KaiC